MWANRAFIVIDGQLHLCDILVSAKCSSTHYVINVVFTLFCVPLTCIKAKQKMYSVSGFHSH